MPIVACILQNGAWSGRVWGAEGGGGGRERCVS